MSSTAPLRPRALLPETRFPAYLRPMKSSSLCSVVRFRRTSLVAGFLAFVASVHAQTTYTNTNTTGTVLWSAGTWSPSAPVSSSTTTLTFSGALTTAATLQNDLGTFNLTTLNDTHTGAFALTISGNQLNFNGTSNAINFNSANADTISAAINFTNGLTVTVSPFTGYTLGGTITGSGGLVKNGSNGSLTISGGNSYTGGTTLNGNTLTLGSNTAAGTGTILLNAGTLSISAARSITNALQIGGNVGLGNGAATFSISGGVNLLNGTRMLSNAGTSAALVTLSGVVSNGALVKDGAGSMLLSNGANTYAGGTAINNGTLQFSTDSSIPTTGNILINNGGALVVNQTSGKTDVASWLGGGKIDSTSSGVIALKASSAANVDFSANGGYNLFLGAYANSTFTGTLTPNGAIYRLGGGGATLTLSGTNTLTGSNSLQVGPSLRVSAVGTPTGAVTNAQTSAGGTVALSASNDMGGTTTVNNGTLSLSGSGGSLVNSDTTVNSNGALNFAPSAAGTVTRLKSATLNGGDLTVTGVAFGTTDTITNTLTLNSGASTITVTPSASGAATLAAASLARTSGQGWALVNGVGLGQDSTSTTNVGRITLTSAPTLVGTTAATTTGINSAAKDTVIVPWLVGAVTSTTGGVGTASAAANTFLTYNASTGLRPLNLTDEFTNNAITGGTNTYMTANTTGSSTAGINSLVVQSITTTGPVLSLNSGVTLSLTSGALLFIPTGATGAQVATIQATSGTATLAFGSAEGVITVQNPITSGSNTATISTVVTGTGGLSKFGAGTLALSNAASTYTGVTTINNGILATTTMANGGSNSGIGAASNAASNLILNGGVLRYAGTVGTTVSTDRLVSVGLLGGGIQSSGTAAINFTNTGTIGFNGESGARTFVLAGATASLVNTFNPIIADNGGPTTLIRTVNGTAQNTVWILGGSNTYTGATQINGDTNNQGGTLSVGVLANGGTASGIGASGNAASNLLINRGSLQYTGATVSTDRLFTVGTSGGTLDASGTGTLTFANTGAVAFTAPGVRTFTLAGTNTGNNTLALLLGDDGDTAVAHATNLSKTGAGTWVLTNANTYSGTTSVTLGVLKAGNAQAFGLNSAVTMTNAASTNLDLNGFNVSIGSLAGGGATGGNVILGAQTLTTGGNNTSTSYAGVISGSGGNVIKTGTGIQTLTAASTYTGSTTISAGTLALGASGTIASTSGVNLGTAGSQGILDLTAKSIFAFGSGQTLSGYGTINIGAGKLVTINGTLAPGNSAGVVTITGDTALTGTTTTTMELAGNGGVAGTDFDKLAVSGALTFAGTLNIVNFGGYDIAQAGTYDLFGFASQAGNFSLVSVAGTALTNNTTTWSASNLNGNGFDYTFTLATGDLVVIATAVPEPSTYAAIFGALALIVTVWRRRASLRSR